MTSVTKEDRVFIITHLNNGEELLKSDDINAVLDPLGDLIDMEGFDGHELNDFGRTAQRVYDRIYYNAETT